MEEAQKYKFGIVLNGSWPEEDLLFVITTSRVVFYERVNVESDIHRLVAGSYECFPRETVINMRQVIAVPVSALLHGREFTIEGVLESADLAAIDRKIHASQLLSPAIKRRILPDNV